MPIKDTRGPQNGVCNICGTSGPLTIDHSPPKGWAPCVPMQVSEVMDPLKSARHKYHKFNDGVRFRSLCERCNRDVLGTQYDPELIRFVQAVTALSKTSLHIAGLQFVRIKPQRVMRSVIGHLCAQGVGRYEKGPDHTEPMRDYMLDPSKPLPDVFSMHYWLFPYPTVVLTRDVSIVNLTTRQQSILWVMKCFPLAFALTERDYVFDGVPPQLKMDPYRHKGVDEVVEVPIDLLSIPPRPFPEHPADNSILLYGAQSTLANSSPIRGKVLNNLKR